MSGDEIRTNRLAALLRSGPLDQLKSFGQGMSNAAASNVSGPVDMLAWLLRKGGLPIPSNPIGGSDWMAQKGLTAEPQNRLAGLLGEGAGLSAPLVAAAKAPQIAGGLLSLDDKAMDMARRGIESRMVNSGMIQPATVWHGSPHKFDKFDSSKIGTGEGAQAYGHGLYLAQEPSVAKSYADTLSQYHVGTRDGVKSGGDFADALVANAGDYPASLSSAIRSQANKVATDLANGKTAEQVVASMRSGPYARMYSGLANAVEKMAPTKAGGSLYKVDLPDNAIAKMLDWDKPLSQQADHVREAVAKNFPGTYINGRYVDPANSQLTGRALLDQLSAIANKRGAPGMRQAEPALQQAGIPGIRYLDGGSRGAGQGSSNFVVFPGNEDLLRILERNGAPIK